MIETTLISPTGDRIRCELYDDGRTLRLVDPASHPTADAVCTSHAPGLGTALDEIAAALPEGWEWADYYEHYHSALEMPLRAASRR
jgi:hypothetical protein